MQPPNPELDIRSNPRANKEDSPLEAVFIAERSKKRSLLSPRQERNVMSSSVFLTAWPITLAPVPPSNVLTLFCYVWSVASIRICIKLKKL